MMAGELTESLLFLERELMDPGFRRQSAKVEALLAEEFREFGASGRVWSRAEIVELLASETPQSAPAVEEFAVHVISGEAVLVTYRAIREELRQVTLRSSIWVMRDGGWRMVFHQGTRVVD
jgi:hypothetical protein